ncbi:hypothetical protein AADZ90_000320 [Aestuariibius sp. 2305UL40-4]|uniref:hypothetical protein n=1 Tax=Aestuariibius violaceus TaxID=3234132 RepID=UPI00345EF8A6
MPTIEIIFENMQTNIGAVEDRTHRIRNFGEDIWRAFHHEEGVKISIRDIDRTTDRVTIAVRKSMIGRVTQSARKMAAKHFPEGGFTVKIS